MSESWAQAVDEQEAATESVTLTSTYAARANVLLACLGDALACADTVLTANNVRC